MADSTRTMRAQDVVIGKFASCYVTIEGQRFLLMQAKNLEAKVEKNKVDVPILGKSGLGHRSTNWNGTGSMTIYNNTDKFNELLLEYKRTGKDIYFDIQVTNEDATTSVGTHTCILKECNFDAGIIAAFDADDEGMEQDIDFTFEDYEIPNKFANLDGME